MSYDSRKYHPSLTRWVVILLATSQGAVPHLLFKVLTLIGLTISITLQSCVQQDHQSQWALLAAYCCSWGIVLQQYSDWGPQSDAGQDCNAQLAYNKP